MSPPGVHRVRVRGRALAVQVRGTGPTVVLEMGGGFGGIGPCWYGVDAELAESCRVVTYDRAGLGASDPVVGHPSMDERAQDLAALLDALDIHERVLLAGWSLGGLIVQTFAARYPDRVGGLLLIDPTPPDFLERSSPRVRWVYSAFIATINRMQLLLARTGFLRSRLGRKFLRKLASLQFGPRMPPAYGEMIIEALARPELHRGMILETDELLRACHEANALLGQQGLPRVPTILLAATHRAGNPESMRPRTLFARILQLMPWADMRELPEVGHMVVPEAPDSVLQAVRDLLARAESGSRSTSPSGSA